MEERVKALEEKLKNLEFNSNLSTDFIKVLVQDKVRLEERVKALEDNSDRDYVYYINLESVVRAILERLEAINFKDMYVIKPWEDRGE